MPQPMLNPMHPPLAKQLIALSIRSVRRRSAGLALSGRAVRLARDRCDVSLRPGAVRRARARDRGGPARLLQPDAVRAIADRDAGYFRARLRPVRRSRRSCTASANRGRIAGSRSPDLGFGLSAACKWSGLFPLAVCIVIVAVIRLMQGWRTQFADGSADDWYRPDLWPDFRYMHFAACFVLIPALVYLATFVPLYGFRFPTSVEAQRRIFSDNTTAAIAGHTYMSSWPSWPLLVRPVWYLFDKIGDDRIAAVVFLGNPLVLWPALLALAICLRDWIVTRRADAFLMLSFYFGPYLAWALLPRTLGFIYYYLPAATFASLALVYALKRGNSPRWLLWAFVAIAFCRLCRDAADLGRVLGTSMATFNRLMIFQNWI